MSSKNILLVISKFPPEYSGPGVRIPRLYQWFKKNGQNYNIQVLCNGVEQVKSAKYQYESMPVQRVVAGGFNKLFSILSFVPKRITQAIIYQAEFLQSLAVLMFAKAYRNTDLVHIAGHSGGTVAALLWAKQKNIPVLMELVTEHARHQQKYLFFFKASIPDNGIVVILTEKAKKSCIELGLSKHKIWCRPNPINENVFYPDFDQRATLRKKLTLFTENQIVIVNVAKMMPQKNQFLILQALSFLSERFVSVLAGPFIQEGPLYKRDLGYVSKMKNFIKENNLQDRVHLVLDFVEADQYMKLGDVYVMPALNEGFGTPMIEAMACGLPVVANKNEAAFQEWIRAGENGYLCDLHAPQEWAQAIEKASEFTEDQGASISADIHKKAGQEAIYTHYEALIKTLITE